MCKALWLSQYKTGSLTLWTCKSLSKYNNHCSSQVADANALYSASEDDLDTVNCFLVRQDMSDFPSKKHCPDIDLLVSIHPAQSASENP
ncbi:hypothetical protein QL285_080500 [Trifolium repens]|nr:hypothetical protein QL285_080500 [Trifolium repens]